MKSQMKGRDFLTLMDFNREEITWFLETASELKRARAKGEPHEHLKGKTIAALFERPSTRTRTSFQAAIAHLGGQSFYMRPDELQLGRGEPLKDTARVVDRYCDALIIRTFEQETVEDFAKHMDNPVINALTYTRHPCQGLADLLTILEKIGHFNNLKLAYSGTIHGVAHTLLILGAIMGINVTLARPEGYDPISSVFDFSKKKAKEAGCEIVITDELEKAISDADIVYANTFHPAGVGDVEKIKKEFSPYQITKEVLELAKGNLIFMHCLPAFRDEEVTEEVIEGSCSVVWDQAENKMHTEKAILALLI